MVISRLAATVMIPLLLGLGGCTENLDPLEQIRERGTLRLVTRNGPTTYYLGRGGELGVDYELAATLARELDVDISVEEAFTLEDLFAALQRGEADIAGAGLSLTDERRQRFTASEAYARQQPQVVYKSGNARPRELTDLAGRRIAVVAGSIHEDLLVEGRGRLGLDLSWEAVATSDPFVVLNLVSSDDADVAIVDSRDFVVHQNLLPRLKVAFDIGTEHDIVWYLPPRAADSPLLVRVNDFLRRRRESGELAELRERYFSKDDSITRVDTQTFVQRMRQSLKDYQQLIEIVAREESLPWELLAAISYQESHWDPNATSPTGVRGMMMLTTATARELGVDDRTDPTQSMRGGARYFKRIRRRLPDDILEPDRTWFALAAYNIGRGHLEDARVLTERRGGDPHLWDDVMENLPLLENQQHFSTLRYGYARGLEAVRYVQNIRHYYDVLRLQSARDQAPQPPVDIAELLPAGLQDLRLLVP
ncbi:MAG: membrane-bound lytic murein transglycosylase MltF [Pseudomonadota bacterium]